ncbi:MAG TPA: ATP-binding cassette domain-containing protein, partial [Saprospiraceae bacterium]|nr:ATP-binding cassette domain-containing protein [Saprospiraceae bacterium]
ISMVSQEAILFNDTVYNNIVFGMEGSDSARVEHAARVANAHDFIINMEHGYDTIIGDRGMKLSGGQRQRLTIARAIYKNAPIIILDEATSALDTESEKLVQEAIKNMLQDKTSLVIAHRLSTIRDADLILVLQQGKIMESGTHRELLERQGYYHKLVQMQEIG